MFSVVVPTLGRNSLIALLDSIPQSPLLVSVIVVGDQKVTVERENELLSIFRSWSRFPIRWARSHAPGVNYSRNLGIELAAVEPVSFLLFLDDDVTLTSSFTWESLRDRFLKSKLLAVGGNYLSRENLGFYERGYNLLCSGWRMASGVSGNEALLGGTWCIRKNELVEICKLSGWFEVEIQYGGAEAPFMQRLRKSAIPNWEILHDELLDVFHAPGVRTFQQWARIANLQRLRLDRVTKAQRPPVFVRIKRVLLFLSMLRLRDQVCFLLFALPFVAAGHFISYSRISHSTIVDQKSK